jgi:LPXTG-site transpeptidase (sortase) family protein
MTTQTTDQTGDGAQAASAQATSAQATSAQGGARPPGGIKGFREPDPMLRGVGAGLCLLGVFLLGFVVYLYGISAIAEARVQTTSYATLRGELSQQLAPIAATAPGAPVAILDIPAIGIKDMIVVEGTSPENLTLGPGHLRSTPLPGEPGVSEILGRRATFGAPFARLMGLRKGDKLTVITGQGTARYTVIARGDSTHLVEDPAPNRLLLITSCSALVPTSYCYLDADLTSAPQQDPGGRPAITAPEAPLGDDGSALVLTMVWGLALVLVSGVGTVAAARWSPWLAYLAATPLALAVLWNLYQSLAALLPNLY